MDGKLFEERQNRISPRTCLLFGRQARLSHAPEKSLSRLRVPGEDSDRSTVDRLEGLLAVPTAVAGEDTIQHMMLEAGQADLSEIVGAACAVRSFAHPLDGRQQHPYQREENTDHQDEFEQREGISPRGRVTAHGRTSLPLGIEPLQTPAASTAISTRSAAPPIRPASEFSCPRQPSAACNEWALR